MQCYLPQFEVGRCYFWKPLLLVRTLERYLAKQ